MSVAHNDKSWAPTIASTKPFSPSSNTTSVVAVAGSKTSLTRSFSFSASCSFLSSSPAETAHVEDPS